VEWAASVCSEFPIPGSAGHTLDGILFILVEIPLNISILEFAMLQAYNLGPQGPLGPVKVICD
jgi:hypothetical protein